MNPASLADLERRGIVVSLTASLDVILSRVERNLDRPLLKVEDKLGKIKELIAVRALLLWKADITVDTDCKNPEQVADEILRV